jgi:hypothetical protein
MSAKCLAETSARLVAAAVRVLCELTDGDPLRGIRDLVGTHPDVDRRFPSQRSADRREVGRNKRPCT